MKLVKLAHRGLTGRRRTIKAKVVWAENTEMLVETKNFGAYYLRDGENDWYRPYPRGAWWLWQEIYPVQQGSASGQPLAIDDSPMSDEAKLAAIKLLKPGQVLGRRTVLPAKTIGIQEDRLKRLIRNRAGIDLFDAVALGKHHKLLLTIAAICAAAAVVVAIIATAQAAEAAKFAKLSALQLESLRGQISALANEMANRVAENAVTEVGQ